MHNMAVMNDAQLSKYCKGLYLAKGILMFALSPTVIHSIAFSVVLSIHFAQKTRIDVYETLCPQQMLVHKGGVGSAEMSHLQNCSLKIYLKRALGDGGSGWGGGGSRWM